MPDKKISERDAAGTLTGTEVIGLIQSGADVKSTLDDVADFVSGGPKVYKAYIGQTSTANPIASAVVNTLGGTPTLTRSETGTYLLTLTGVFTIFKTFVPRLLSFYPSSDVNFFYVTVSQNSADSFTIRSYYGANGSASLSDGVLTEVTYDIEIYVYP